MKVSKTKECTIFLRLYDYQFEYITKISDITKISKPDTIRKIIDSCIYENSKNNK